MITVFHAEKRLGKPNTEKHWHGAKKEKPNKGVHVKMMRMPRKQMISTYRKTNINKLKY